jgi:hypothetical protein
MAAGIRRRCGAVALVVGTILNLINQGEALFGAATVSWAKLVLTYLVPFFVCAYGALTAGRPAQRSS